MAFKRVRLCIIHPNIKCGGSERFISILCKYINTAVFEVELYILDGSDRFYKINNPDIKVSYFAKKKVRNALPLILNILKKTKPDILFTTSNHLNLFISIFKFLLPKKLIFVAEESSIVSINSKRSDYGKLYELLIKIFYKNIDYIVCQSAYMKDDLVKNFKIPNEKTTIIYNPVEEIPVKEKTADQRPGNKYKFFTVGRLSPEKGIDRILRSLSLITEDFTFHIIGDGPEKNNLLQLTAKVGLKNKVIFEGQKSDPYENMNDADLFLIGSHYEGFPNVLLEAGMLGMPTVGFKAPGGMNEIIIDGVNGFLITDDDSGIAYKNAILAAVKHPFNRNEIIELIKNKFSAKKITEQFEAYLLKVYQSNLPA